MSLTGDGQNVNVNGNLVLPGPSTKIRTPLIQFSDNTTLSSANGVWSSNLTNEGVSYSGNATAQYFFGNASTLTSLTGAAAGTYGSGVSVPSVTVDATGRISSISSTAINTVSTGTSGQLAYYTASNTVGGDVGLGYTSGTQTLTVGGSVKVGGDLFVSGNTYTGNNAVFNDAIVEIGNSYPNGTTVGLLMQRPAGNVMMGYLSTEGGSAYTNTLVFGYTFSSAAGSVLTPDLGNTLPVEVLGSVTATGGVYGSVLGSNTVSASTLTTSSNVGLGTASTANTLTVGSNLFVTDTGSNVLVVVGNVSATRFTGNGSTLTGLTGASAGSYGNATTVSQITVDATGRITSVANVSIASQSANLAQVVNLGNATANTVLFTNTTTSLVASGNVLIQGQSNLVGNTVASNLSVFSISFGGTSNGYVRSISLQDTTDISNSTTDYVTVAGLSTTVYNPVFLTSVGSLGTWGATPTPALGGASLGSFSATIGASITNFTPSDGLVNGEYKIYGVSNGSWTVAASMAGSVSNLAAPLSLSTGNRVLIRITYDGTVYYVEWTKYS